MITANVTLTLSGTAPTGDVIENNLYYSTGSLSMATSARSYIVSRSITGLVWLDEDGNGIQNEGSDGVLANMLVELLLWDDTSSSYQGLTGEVASVANIPVTVTTSKTTNSSTLYANVTIGDKTCGITATASSDGSYEFSGLPAGKYAVRFSPATSSDLDFSKLVASPQYAASAYLDSDAVGYYYVDGSLDTSSPNASTFDNTLQYTLIEVELPEASEIYVASYVESYLDSGLAYKPGNLTISKTLAGNTPESDREFEFTVSLDDTTLSGDYTVTYSDNRTGTATFEGGALTKAAITGEDDATAIYLKGGQNVTIEGLPANTEYTVTETVKSSYSTTYEVDDEGSEGGTSAQGTISAGAESKVAFTNTRGEGDLVISKTVSGTGANENQDFSFTVNLYDSDGETALSGSYTATYTDGSRSEVTITNGVATISLKHGESVTIADLPAGAKYTVSETADPNYTTSVSVNSGQSQTLSTVSGDISASTGATLAFTSTRIAGGSLVISDGTGTSGSGTSGTSAAKSTLPQTGDEAGVLLALASLAALGASALASLAALALRKQRRIRLR